MRLWSDHVRLIGVTRVPSLTAIALLACAVSCDSHRGSRTFATPTRVTRIAAGTVVDIGIGSNLEIKRSNGSFSSETPRHDPVAPRIVAAEATPASVATVRVGRNASVEITGVSAGSATVRVGGGVEGRPAMMAFPIEIVEAAALDYYIALDLDEVVSVNRGGDSIILARGFCYTYWVESSDATGAALDNFGNAGMSQAVMGDLHCGTRGLVGLRAGRVTLPRVGTAKPLEVEFVDPKLEVVWTSVRGNEKTLYEPRVIARDSAGKRIALPFQLPVRMSVLTPATCAVSVGGASIERSATGECRANVLVPRSGLPGIEISTSIPDDDIQSEVALFGEAEHLAFGMTPDDVARVAPNLRTGTAERAMRAYTLVYHQGRLREITILAPHHDVREIASRWKRFTGIHERNIYSLDGRIHGVLEEVTGGGYRLRLRPAMSYPVLLGPDSSAAAPAGIPVLGTTCAAIVASLDAAALTHEDVDGGIRVTLPDLEDAERDSVTLTIPSCAAAVRQYVIALTPRNSTSAPMALTRAVEERWDRQDITRNNNGSMTTDYTTRTNVRIALTERGSPNITSVTATEAP